MGNETWTRIGDCCNYYGGIKVCKTSNKFYMGVENYNGIGVEDCDEIHESLYNELIKFAEEYEHPNP